MYEETKNKAFNLLPKKEKKNWATNDIVNINNFLIESNLCTALINIKSRENQSQLLRFFLSYFNLLNNRINGFNFMTW